MKKTHKVRFILEATIEQDTEFTPEVVRRIWTYQNVEEMIPEDYWLENIRQNQVMLATILADPKKYHLLLLDALQQKLNDSGEEFFQLAGYDTGNKGHFGYDVVEGLVDALPAESAECFRGMNKEGVLSERTELVRFSTDVTLTRLQVEEIE